MLLIPTLLCPKPWEGMTGDESRRFCSYCKKHVHNLDIMSVSERLALLSSPAASICARYQVAIRRPVKGKEESYAHHLFTYGAGVAISGSVLLVLWEMEARADQAKWQIENPHFYRAASTNVSCYPMPKEFYCEHRMTTLGAIAIPRPPASVDPAKGAEPPFQHVDIKLDPGEINRLIDQSRSRVLQNLVLPVR